MKRLIIIITIIIFLFTLGFSELFYVKNTIQKLDVHANNLYEKFESYEADLTPLLPEINTMKKYWLKKEPILCLMFNHKDLSIITDSIKRLYSYSKNNGYDDAYNEITALKEYIEKSGHIMGFNIQNIM